MTTTSNQLDDKILECDGLPARERGHEVVRFWRALGPQAWFAKNDEVDRRFGQKFSDLHFAAARHECDHWLSDPDAGLGLILLLDQFPRNVFRNTAHMFATDPLARHYAQKFIEKGLVTHIDEDLRLFACLPFVHSENLDDHDMALELYQRYAPDSLTWAEHHRSIIVRFGRFPHRNACLARISTPEEQQFLSDGGFKG